MTEIPKIDDTQQAVNAEKPTVVIFAFEEFVDEVNITELIANQLGEDIDRSKVNVETVILPVDYEKAGALFDATVAKVNPDYIIAMGEDNFRHSTKRIDIEIMGNENDYIPDIDGTTPNNNPNKALVGGLFLDNPDVLQQLADANITHKIPTSATQKNSVGGYLCGFITNKSLEYMADKGTPHRAIFCHIADPIAGSYVIANNTKDIQLSEADLAKYPEVVNQYTAPLKGIIEELALAENNMPPEQAAYKQQLLNATEQNLNFQAKLTDRVVQQQTSSVTSSR